MTITQIKNNTKLTVAVSGRLDTTTTPELEKYLGNALTGITELVFDFKELTYISSAGLRVLLATFKSMGSGTIKVINVSDAIMDIFEITGFSDILSFG